MKKYQESMNARNLLFHPRRRIHWGVGLGRGKGGCREEIERRGADAKLILETAAKYGVPPEMLWRISQRPN
jgi:hypothetical protein